MVRETEFRISRRPYAVDLASLAVEPRGKGFYGTVSAIWFRRRKGVTVACTGFLGDLQRYTPANVYDFLARHDDGRYGGDCLGRWDGQRYWGAQEPDMIKAHLDLLRPMLASYPAVPPGYDGWWRF